MSIVKWHIVDRNKAVREGKKVKKYYDTTLSSLMLDWEDNRDVKFIKVSYGRKNYIEFMLYHSTNYFKNQKKWNKNIVAIEDKYQLVSANAYLTHIHDKTKNPKEAQAAKSLLFAMEKLGVRYPKLENWVTLDELNELMLEIDELMENLEEYEVLDQLSDF